MKSVLFVLIGLTILIGSQAQNISIPDAAFTTVTITQSAKIATLRFSIPSNLRPTKTNFYVFPCFGSFNWQLGYNEIPAPGNPDNVCSQPWQEGSTYSFCFYYTPDNGTVFYVSAQGQYTASNSLNAAAMFDVYFYNGDYQILNSLVPNPGNNGELVATPISKLKRGQKQTITLSWAGTGNANDTYTVYTHVGSLDSAGAQTQTGCGVKNTGLMTPANVTITQTDTNKYSAVLTNVDPKKDLVFNVVVERKGGYINAYTATTYNGSSMIVVSPILMMLSLLIAFFMN